CYLAGRNVSRTRIIIYSTRLAPWPYLRLVPVKVPFCRSRGRRRPRCVASCRWLAHGLDAPPFIWVNTLLIASACLSAGLPATVLAASLPAAVDWLHPHVIPPNVTLR